MMPMVHRVYNEKGEVVDQYETHTRHEMVLQRRREMRRVNDRIRWARQKREIVEKSLMWIGLIGFVLMLAFVLIVVFPH